MMVAALLVYCLLPGQVELRGGVIVEAPVEAVTIEGVAVGGDAPRTIGWHSVKRVAGDATEEAEPFSALADMAWRARQRLSRHDISLAQPLYEELYLTYRGRSGPTALMVAEGLLRCRLQRADLTGAFDPWLEVVRLRRSGMELAGDPQMRPVVDPATGLVPAFPPIWIATDELERFAVDVAIRGDSGASHAESDEAASAALRMYYVNAARAELGEPVTLVDTPIDPSDEGLLLVARIVHAQAGDEQERKQARAEIRARLEHDAGTWREAWQRVALGRSLLAEPAEELRTEGLLHLLHLPARFAESQPYLAGIALAESALELQRRGDVRARHALYQELLDLTPNHPARDWLDQQLEQELPVDPIDGPSPMPAPTELIQDEGTT